MTSRDGTTKPYHASADSNNIIINKSTQKLSLSETQGLRKFGLHSKHVTKWKNSSVPTLSFPHSTLREVWQYSERDFERACEMLDNTNWDSIFDTENINHCWREWQTTSLNIMSLCIPKKTL